MANRCIFLIAIFLAVDAATAAAPQPRVTFAQKLSSQVPGSLTFRDELGRSVQLGSLYGKKPTILSLVYFRCPNLCTLVTEGIITAIQALPQKLGTDYQVLSVSIDPSEGPPLALARKRATLARLQLGGPLVDQNPSWHFLTGKPSEIHSLADAVGFDYSRDPASGQYAHGSGFVVLTPGGRVSRYFFGIKYPSTLLSQAISRAARNRIGTLVDQLLLICFHYDPITGKYGSLITNALRAGGLLTIAGLVALFYRLSRSEGGT